VQERLRANDSVAAKPHMLRGLLIFFIAVKNISGGAVLELIECSNSMQKYGHQVILG